MRHLSLGRCSSIAEVSVCGPNSLRAHFSRKVSTVAGRLRWPPRRNNSNQSRPMLKVGCNCVDPSAVGVSRFGISQLPGQLQQLPVTTDISAYLRVVHMLNQCQRATIPKCQRRAFQANLIPIGKSVKPTDDHICCLTGYLPSQGI